MSVLDQLEGWTLTEAQGSAYHNDLAALSVTWLGLEHLYSTVRRAEEIAREQFRPDIGFRSSEVVEAKCLARCAFDWYAVSACNFVSLTGWIAKQIGLTLQDHKKYVTKVLPAVEIHRHKIAAHYSRHSPKEDSDALQLASTMFFSLSEINGRLVANGFRLAIRRRGTTSDSSTLLPWSLVDVHEELRKRYSAPPASSTQ